MSALFDIKESHRISPAPVVAATGPRVDETWAADMQQHQGFAQRVRELSRRQTTLMEALRLKETALAPTDVQAIDDGLYPKLNEGPAWARKMARDQGKPPVLVLGAAEELAALDVRIKDLRRAMGRLEVDILTKDPVTADESVMMLRFLASLLASGVKIDPDYIGDLLEACAEGI